MYIYNYSYNIYIERDIWVSIYIHTYGYVCVYIYIYIYIYILGPPWVYTYVTRYVEIYCLALTNRDALRETLGRTNEDRSVDAAGICTASERQACCPGLSRHHILQHFQDKLGAGGRLCGLQGKPAANQPESIAGRWGWPS